MSIESSTYKLCKESSQPSGQTLVGQTVERFEWFTVLRTKVEERFERLRSSDGDGRRENETWRQNKWINMSRMGTHRVFLPWSPLIKLYSTWMIIFFQHNWSGKKKCHQGFFLGRSFVKNSDSVYLQKEISNNQSICYHGSWGLAFL